MMAFGKMRYREAEPLIRKYIPRNFTLGELPRASATWAIGFFYDEPPGDLVGELTGRLNDVRSSPPEYGDVRTMSALTLGRIGAKSAVPDLERYADDRGGFTSQACHWSIEQLTGKPAPGPIPAFQVDYDDWFLRPIKESQSK